MITVGRVTPRTPTHPAPPSEVRPPLTATLAAEWMKLRAMRSTWVLATVGLVLGVAVAALVAVAVGAAWDDWSAEERADVSPIISPLVGAVFTGVLVVMLGVKVGAAEYQGGLSRLTLAATPRRGRVLAAKCLLVVLLSWVVALVATVGMFVVAQLVFASYGVTTVSLSDGDAVRAVGISVALAPLFPLTGMALALLFRGAAGAMAAVLALLFAPAVFGGLLPPWWEENVLAYLPAPASDSIAYSHIDDSSAYLPVGVAIIVVTGWLTLFIAAAYHALTTRDA